jgi:hypothetical protein
MINKFKYPLLLVLFLATGEILYSQDSIVAALDSSKVYYFRNDLDLKGVDLFKEIDTLITNIEKYDPLMKPGNYYATLGNPGLAHNNMVFTPYIKTGFDYGIHSFDRYILNNDSVSYYWFGKPYTNVFYIMGPKKEQNLMIDHSQNIGNLIKFGLNFKYTHSPGFYLRQKADDKNFVLKARYHTKDYRYMVLANYLHNSLKMEENGGIRYDSVFEENVKPQRNGIEVNLKEASNLLKEDSYYVKQMFALSRKESMNPGDTIETKGLKVSPGIISLSTLISKFQYKFEDTPQDNSFYNNTYDTINNTHDSTRILKIENTFSWSNTSFKHKQKLLFKIAVKHQYVEHSDDTVFKNYYNLLIPSGYVSFRFIKNMNLDFYGNFVTGSDYVGDYTLKGNLKYSTRYGTLALELNSIQNEAGRYFLRFHSNHFRWDNSFAKQKFSIQKFNYSYKELQAGVQLTNASNLVYLDTLALPAQTSSLSVLKIYLRKKFTIKKWSLDLRVIYQATNNDIVRIPDLIGDGALYFTSHLFKNAAIIQTGLDLFYNTNYYSYNYSPGSKMFFLQDEKKTGDYVYANVFLNLQIKRSRLFVEYTNLAFYLKDFKYYTTPSYPMQDPGFRFGISWMFYD